MRESMDGLVGQDPRVEGPGPGGAKERTSLHPVGTEALFVGIA
ncbi:hypothetical protein [Pseudarthrobacter sp. 1C304]